AGNPRRVSCAIEILSFQNFYKVLKTCSAGRKDFFDTLTPTCVSTQAGALFSAEVIFPSRRIFYCGQLLFLP
ncbi:hypothetical protein, partial [uncultured Dysosmobacter sp.]|uniref:hypothetical protein n=1 Tax=uncultured Dysosmobacter sp. TaxID=2591384 RepID=UPI00267169AA